MSERDWPDPNADAVAMRAERDQWKARAEAHLAYAERVDASLDALRAERDAALARVLAAETQIWQEAGIYDTLTAEIDAVIRHGGGCEAHTSLAECVRAEIEAARTALLSRLTDEDTVQVAANAARNDRKGWHPDVLRKALEAVRAHLQEHQAKP